MKQEQVIAFLPCRKGSKRVVGKNIRRFGGVEGGLTRIKLGQLMDCAAIDRVVVSTDDEAVMTICHDVAGSRRKPLEVLHRDGRLAADDTSTDDLVRHVPEIIPGGVVLWTHVTSPFLGAEQYEAAIAAYGNAVASGKHDSLMSVTRIQTFLWDESGPVNYDRTREKWPATQSLPPLFEVNSGLFLIEAGLMRRFDDRIGERPFLYETGHLHSFDIDTESQFELGDRLWRAVAVG